MARHDDGILKQPAVMHTAIPGWGADANPADRPAVPMEKPSNVMNVRGEVGDRMRPKVKIHLSIEHPDLPPVFGTTCPPRGVSGSLRDFAYKFGEGRLAHWMTLMLADRVDVLEGRIDDLAHGRLPNPYKERGLGAEFKYASKSRKRNNAIVLGSVIGIVAVVAVAASRRD
jgi:hypothetical protein